MNSVPDLPPGICNHSAAPLHCHILHSQVSFEFRLFFWYLSSSKAKEERFFCFLCSFFVHPNSKKASAAPHLTVYPRGKPRPFFPSVSVPHYPSIHHKRQLIFSHDGIVFFKGPARSASTRCFGQADQAAGRSGPVRQGDPGLL